MLETAYKYSESINAKGEQFSTESLVKFLLFEQYKKVRDLDFLSVLI